MLDAADIKLGKDHPQNTPMRRAWRVLDAKIAAAERELQELRFLRDVLEHELKD